MCIVKVIDKKSRFRIQLHKSPIPYQDVTVSRIHNTGLSIVELVVFKSVFLVRGQSGWVCVAGYMKAKTMHKRRSLRIFMA